MAKAALSNRGAVGGYSFNEKEGVQRSVAFAQSLEFRKNSTTVKLKPKTVKESGSTVVTEIRDAAQDPNTGDIYFAGGTEIYKRTPETAGGNGTYSVFATPATLVNVQSILYKHDRDAMIAVDNTVVHQIKDMSGTPTLEAEKYDKLLDQSATGGTNNYTLATSIAEGATHKLSYVPTIEPLIRVVIDIDTVGTGNWTLTMHDDANNTLGSVTIANGSLSTGNNNFDFTTAVRMLVKPNARTYHFHLTSTVADGVAHVTTASDFSTANYETHAQRLISAEHHPIIEFQQFVCIGNERYLTAWEPLSDEPLKTEWLPHRLTFPSNYQVLGLALYDEYLAIACFKKKSSDYGSDFGQDATEGIIFFWDGTSTTYNFYVIIPEGAPESIFSYKNVIYYKANGRTYAWAGGRPVLIRAFPGVDNFTTNESHDADVYLQSPYNAMTVHDGVMQMGFPYKTVNESILHGVYSWGSQDKNYADSFGYDHVPSHGRTGTVFVNSGTPPVPISGISMVKSFGANMYIAWRDSADDGATTDYGVDVVRDSNDPYASGKLENLIFDNDQVWKDKQAIEYIVNFESLPASASVTPKYKLDRGSWVNGITVNTAGATKAKISIQNKRFREIETGYDLVGSSSGSPEITGDTLIFDDLRQEEL